MHALGGAERSSWSRDRNEVAQLGPRPLSRRQAFIKIVASSSHRRIRLFCRRSIWVFRRICLPARRLVPIPLMKRSFMKASDQTRNAFRRLVIKRHAQHFGLTTVNLAPA
jgi:hypothetical protein